MKKQQYFLMTAALVVPLLFGTNALAAENLSNRGSRFTTIGRGEKKPSVVGTVSSVGGSTITVDGKDNTSYIVDTSNAKIVKGFKHGNSSLSLNDIKTGDEVAVFGSISGTSVVATSVIDEVHVPNAKHKNNSSYLTGKKKRS